MQVKLRHYSPSEALSPYIRNYFFFQSNSPGRFKLFPVGNPRLIFYTKGTVHLTLDGITFCGSEPTLSGQFKQFYELSLSPGTEFMGISFFPTGLYRLLGVDGRAVVNRIEPMKTFLHEPEYEQAVKTAQTDEEIIALHEAFLLKKLRTEQLLPPVVDQCIADNHMAEGNVLVDELVEKYRCSRRYLEKHFIYGVGMSPGKYAKRVRFFMVMRKIIQEKASIQKILDSFNYYDLSHLMKDFECFMGEKPQKYFRNDYPMMELFVREECLYRMVN